MGLADGVAAEHRPRRKKAGLPVPDPQAVRRVDPFTRPKERTRSIAPVVYGPPEHVEEWRAHHAELRAAYSASSLTDVPGLAGRPQGADGALAAQHAAAGRRAEALRERADSS
ncbi:MAG: hypothetical protein R3F60_17745 [bacterium]